MERTVVPFKKYKMSRPHVQRVDLHHPISNLPILLTPLNPLLLLNPLPPQNLPRKHPSSHHAHRLLVLVVRDCIPVPIARCAMPVGVTPIPIAPRCLMPMGTAIPRPPRARRISAAVITWPVVRIR